MADTPKMQRYSTIGHYGVRRDPNGVFVAFEDHKAILATECQRIIDEMVKPMTAKLAELKGDCEIQVDTINRQREEIERLRSELAKVLLCPEKKEIRNA